MTENELVKESFEDLLESLRKDTPKEDIQKSRKLLNLLTQLMKVYAVAQENLISCTHWQLRKLRQKRLAWERLP